MAKVFIYSQSTGLMQDDLGRPIADGWAGNGAGKNNPAMQDVRAVGPLPQGLYRVEPWQAHHPHLGPWVAHLVQVEGETFGRDAFFIHGPSLGGNFGQESKGCIVLPRPGRLKVRDAAPDFVRVVA